MNESVRSIIARTMNIALSSQRWSSVELCGLPPSYARDSLVTPYFHCSSIVLKPYGGYTVEGVLGVIHQGFEKLWMQNEDREVRVPGFGVVLNIVNIAELSEHHFIPSDGRVEANVGEFCAALCRNLEEMPSDEAALFFAIQRDLMLGRPWRDFSGYAYRQKFRAFIEFVGQLK